MGMADPNHSTSRPLTDTEALLAVRNKEYGEAHFLTSSAMLHLRVFERPIGVSMLFFHWVIILNKLIRAIASPYKVDHWADIAGYAELAQNVIKNSEVGEL